MIDKDDIQKIKDDKMDVLKSDKIVQK